MAADGRWNFISPALVKYFVMFKNIFKRILMRSMPIVINSEFGQKFINIQPGRELSYTNSILTTSLFRSEADITNYV